LRDLAKAPAAIAQSPLWYFPRADRSWHQSFETLRGNGRIFVAPILQILILNH
jgi:hypothetical protein